MCAGNNVNCKNEIYILVDNIFVNSTGKNECCAVAVNVLVIPETGALFVLATGAAVSQYHLFKGYMKDINSKITQ